MTLLAKVLGAAAVVAAPVWGFLKLWDRKADKQSVVNNFQRVENELAIQRGHIGKIFDKLAESETRHEERHRELMMHMLNNHKP